MELTSYVAGEPWSDHPACACPVITAFLVSWNDALPDDATRDRLLKPLIPLIVNTRSTPEVEKRRSFMALDWLIRVNTPKWLDMVPALQEHAVALRGFNEIVDMAGAVAAGERVRPARDAAGDAARDAARDAAWDATGAATVAGAGAAARDAAWYATWFATVAEAGAATGAAARDAAWAATVAGAGAAAAAWAALKPTTEWLQTSALSLVHRMVEAS